MCHTYHNPRNQLPFPFQLKKQKKNKKKQEKNQKENQKKTKKKPKKKNQKNQKKKQKKNKKNKNKKKQKKKTKKQKKPKARTTHAHFFRLPHGLERSKRDIHIHLVLGCQGDSDDVIGSK